MERALSWWGAPNPYSFVLEKVGFHIAEDFETLRSTPTLRAATTTSTDVPLPCWFRFSLCVPTSWRSWRAMAASGVWTCADAAVVNDTVATELYTNEVNEMKIEPKNGWIDLDADQRVKELQDVNNALKADIEKLQELMKAKDEQVARIDAYEKMMTLKN